MRHTIRLRAVVATACAACALLPSAAVAANATVTRKVPSTLEFRHLQDPTDPGHCSASAFLRWKDVRGVVAATAKFGVATSGAPRAEQITKAAPYDDVFDLVGRYEVAPGYHWISIASNWRDGAGADDCSAAEARLRAVVVAPTSVELTVKRSTAPTIRSKTPSSAKVIQRRASSVGTISCPRGGLCPAEVLTPLPLQVRVGRRLVTFDVKVYTTRGGRTKPILVRARRLPAGAIGKRYTIRVKVRATNSLWSTTKTVSRTFTIVPAS